MKQKLISSNLERIDNMTNSNNGSSSKSLNLILASEVRRQNEEASKKPRVYFKVSGSVLLTDKHGKKVNVTLNDQYRSMKIFSLSGKIDAQVLLGAREILKQQVRLDLPLGIEKQLRFEKLEVVW